MDSLKSFILHLDLDSFFVSVECLLDPSLKGKAVAIGGETRGVVSSCSYEARKFGVHSAMPIIQAKRLCPELITVSSGMAHYSHYSKMVTDIISKEAPKFQKSSIDEFYLDLTGMDKYFGCYEWASNLRQKIIKDTGLPISFGLASNKMIAKIATGEAKPNGQLYIKHGEEKAFLAPLPIGKIPMIGAKSVKVLRSYGYHFVRDLQRVNLEKLVQLFGENHGNLLWKKANGISSSEIVPYSDAKSISKESTFFEDVNSSEKLLLSLAKMTEKLAFKLRNKGFKTACIALKFRYPTFKTITRQTTILPTNIDTEIYPQVQTLFRQHYTEGEKIRLIGLRFSQLSSGTQQLNLFAETNKKQELLYKAVDSLKLKHGMGIIQKAGTLNPSNKKSIKGDQEKEKE